MKKIVVSITLILSMVLFVGCGYNENKICNALQKTSQINSCEMDSEVKLTLETEGFGDTEDYTSMMYLNMAKALLNNSEFKLHTKMIQDEERTSIKNYGDLYVNLNGLGVGMEFWQTIQDDAGLQQIIKVPAIYMMAMNQLTGSESKEYMVMNNEELTIDISIKEIQELTNKFMTNFIAQYDPQFELIDFKDTDIVDGETVYNYVLSLDNESLTELMDYTVNNVLDYEDGIDYIKDYIKSVVAMTQKNMPNYEELDTMVEEIFEDFADNKEEIKAGASKVVDLINECEILGEKGIEIVFTLDKDGYIVNKSGNIDLNLDLTKIQKAANKMAGVETTIENMGNTQVIKLGIEFNTKIYNINEEIEIDVPEITEDNSMDLLEMMNGYYQGYPTAEEVEYYDVTSDDEIMEETLDAIETEEVEVEVEEVEVEEVEL